MTNRIDGAVKKARKVEGWRSEYMFYDINLMDARYEGQVEGRELGRAEERAKTEAERKRADAAESKAKAAESKADAALAELAKYKEKYGEIV